mmetsp:Transcript_22235/g.24718  ORF Transcript_22235/g.24718 Transcript_22235/m.24718 type:complete len:677 (+) Transcript_22235:27-2057(+)
MSGVGIVLDLARNTAAKLPSVVGAYKKDKRLLLVLGGAFAGLSYLTTNELKRLVRIRSAISQRHKAEKVATDLARAAREAKGEHAPEKKTRRGRAGVDGLFLKRLMVILRICVPSATSTEALLLYIQTLVLIARSLLSLRMARLMGLGLKSVVMHDMSLFHTALMDYFFTGVCASVVNAGIKYLTNSIDNRFRYRLTRYIHSKYMGNRNYYKSAVLRVGNLDNADQRIVVDINNFCKTASDLFSRTFKPALDVILNTMRMAENMGYTGLTVLYSYFFLSGGVIRALSPSFGKLITEQAKLNGEFHHAHSRLITAAEEVAFLDGSTREEGILNKALKTLTDFNSHMYMLRFKQGVVDQFSIKYMASMVGWPILALPFLANKAESVADTAAAYRESDSLIQSASSSVGDLMMVYKKLQKLSGYTTRTVELIEAVEDSDRLEGEKRLKLVAESKEIEFNRVTIKSPDGRILLKDLELRIQPGQNVFVTGANGAGKTSLFRVLAGLWGASDGHVVRPTLGQNAEGAFSLFYVPQKPYLVMGSLRDQITYPLLLEGEEKTSADDRILEVLAKVNLTRLATGTSGLDRAPHDWADVLSGGERQRVSMARLYFHSPAFAVLDEATSAINPDEEGALYRHLGELGITVFSIAHRMELRSFHHQHLHFHADNTGGWTLTPLAELP